MRSRLRGNGERGWHLVEPCLADPSEALVAMRSLVESDAAKHVGDSRIRAVIDREGAGPRRGVGLRMLVDVTHVDTLRVIFEVRVELVAPARREHVEDPAHMV